MQGVFNYKTNNGALVGVKFRVANENIAFISKTEISYTQKYIKSIYDRLKLLENINADQFHRFMNGEEIMLWFGSSENAKLNFRVENIGWEIMSKGGNK